MSPELIQRLNKTIDSFHDQPCNKTNADRMAEALLEVLIDEGCFSATIIVRPSTVHAGKMNVKVLTPKK